MPLKNFADSADIHIFAWRRKQHHTIQMYGQMNSLLICKQNIHFSFVIILMQDRRYNDNGCAQPRLRMPLPDIRQDGRKPCRLAVRELLCENYLFSHKKLLLVKNFVPLPHMQIRVGVWMPSAVRLSYQANPQLIFLRLTVLPIHHLHSSSTRSTHGKKRAPLRDWNDAKGGLFLYR